MSRASKICDGVRPGAAGSADDAGMGAMLGVRQTPTLFINGRKLEGGLDPRLLDAVIELEAQRDKYKPRPRIDSCRLALGMQQRADCPG
jgi:hypothetical protein